MKKNLLKLGIVATMLLMVSTNVKAWTIDFLALGAKYVDKTGVTISEAVVSNVGTVSIVNGTLAPVVNEEETTEEQDTQEPTTATDVLYGNFALQSGSSWLIRPGGLYSANGGGRSLGILNCKKDQNITIDITIAPNTPANVELKSQEGNKYVFTVLEDGDVIFNIARYSYITNISVNWEIDFLSLGGKYVDKTGVTISTPVVSNVGTCSIVNGTLQTPIDIDEETQQTTDNDVLDPSFALQSGSSWIIRSGGLYSANGGGRNLGILNCKKDQAVTFDITIAPSTPANAELKSQEGNVYVYTVKEDGDVIFSITRYSYIAKVSVGDVAGVEYTVKFVNENGDPIKQEAKHKGEVGTTPELTASDVAPVYINGVKYVVKSSDAESLSIAEDGTTVVTVVFVEAPKYNWRARLFFDDGEGANGTRINNPYWEGTIYEGDNLTIHYPMGFKHPTDGKWYLADRVGSYEGRNITIKGEEPEGSRILADVKYKLPSNPDSLVYVGEFEDNAAMTLTGTVATWTGWGDILYNNSASIAESNTAFTDDHYSFWRFDRFSNGAGPRLTNGSYFTINDAFAESGSYAVSIYLRNGSSSTTERPALYLQKTEGSDLEKALSDEIPTTGGAGIGYVVIKNVQIPAGAKLVVMNDGEADNIDLDLISITRTGDYDLKKMLRDAVDDANAVSTEGKSAEAVAAFNTALEAAQAIMDKADATAEEIEQATEALEQAIAGLITDSIASVNVNGQKNGVIYNLAGQAVKAAQKGLYIRNGKKFVVK